MLNEPTFLYGLHDAGGEQLFLDAQVHGWIVFNEFVGRDPADHSGVDYSAWADRGFGVIVKLQHGFNPLGTIPEATHYEQFADRCARFAAVSEGCHIWVIGNEMNYWAARPGAYAKTHVPVLDQIREPAEIQAVLRALPERFDALHTPHPASAVPNRGQMITPDRYAACYRQCRNAILAAQAEAMVLVGAITPWNSQTRYAGNETGDWVTYLNDILVRLGPHGCDGIALHAFTVDADPASVTRDTWLEGHFQHRRGSFRAFRDCMQGIPLNMRHLPVYLVEADQFQAWPEQDTGWIGAVHAEIHDWNRQAGHQQIRCLALFRWAQSPGDRWQLSAQPALRAAYRAVLQEKYQWDPARMPLPDPGNPAQRVSLTPGMVVETTATINLRALPGFIGVAPDALLTKLPAGHRCLLADGPMRIDSLIWWQIHTTDEAQQPISGWLAQAGVDGQPYIRQLTGAPDLSEPFEPSPIYYDDAIGPGTYFLLRRDTELRHAPGTLGKDTGDIAATVPANTPGLVLEGPQYVEDAIWWRARCAWPEGSSTQGWLQEVLEADEKNIQVIAVPGSPPAARPRFQIGDTVHVLRPLLLRRVPGLESEALDAIVLQLAPGLALTVEGGPRHEDELIWWQIATSPDIQPVLRGWVADTSVTGYELLGQAPPEIPGQAQYAFQPGDDVYIILPTELQRIPGVSQQQDYDVLDVLPRNTLCRILGSPLSQEQNLWWQIAVTAADRERLWGWVVHDSGDGEPRISRDPLPVHLAPVPRRSPGPRERQEFAAGARVVNVSSSSVRIRATPGYVNKPAGDIIIRAPRRAVMLIQGGPQIKDGLRWWLVQIVHPETRRPSGWVAEGTQGGIRILAYDFLADHISASNPFNGSWPLSQAWGSNPAFYQRFKYNGVPLKGHNGFDFALPVGTPLLAVDEGKVIHARVNVGGFGKYVLMEHDWGESVYAHMDRLDVSLGQILPRHGHLGLSGNTGASTGPHLHFGIRIVPYRRADGWGGFCNPAPFMNISAIFRERPVPMPPSPIGTEDPDNPLP